MVCEHNVYALFRLLTFSHLDLSRRNGCLLANSWWSYQTCWAFRRSCILVHHGLELLVQLDYHLAGWVICCFHPYQLLESSETSITFSWSRPNISSQTVNNAAWISICLVVVVVINMFGAGELPSLRIFVSFIHSLISGAYGECEFVFASIKVITITGLIVSCLVRWSNMPSQSIHRFSASSLILAVVPPMIGLVSVTGKTLGLSSNSMASLVTLENS